MDSLLKDLSVVGQVPRHGRISSDRDGLYLERNHPLLSCKRYFFGDSRTQLVRDLKELVERVDLLYDASPELVGSLVTECVKGLNRLHETTYSGDAVMRSQLKIQAGNLSRSSRRGTVHTSSGPASHSSRPSAQRSTSLSSQTHAQTAEGDIGVVTKFTDCP